MNKHRLTLFISLTTLAVALAAPTRAQLTYTSGRPAWPAYEGWMKNEDGSIDLLFGYMNENWQEELDVPVGPDNSFSPGMADAGQPTHFLPRRNRFVFKVRVPKDFGDKELVWTLTTHGNTAKAYGSTKTDLMVENIDIMSETGALGAGTSNPEVRANQPPVIKLEGTRTRTVKVGQPLTLAAVISDDGVPRRRGLGRPGRQTGRGASEPVQAQSGNRGLAFTPPTRITVGKATGLHLSWFVYRGGKGVDFDPPQTKVWEDTRAGANSPWAPLWSPSDLPPDGRWVTQVTFSQPGIYVLHGRADDGGLYSDEAVIVSVTR